MCIRDRVNAGLTLNFTDEKEKDPATGKPWKESWCYQNGIADYEMCIRDRVYTLWGIPSIYYGSEFGIEGKKEWGSDWRCV